MLLGLDFDNTLIRYDALFHQVALERARPRIAGGLQATARGRQVRRLAQVALP